MLQHVHKYAIVTTARWEEQNIVEWIEYHRSIGFDHFYVYGHDDEPLTLYHALFPYLIGADPVVTYRYWPKPGQFAAMYLDFLRNHAAQTEWFGFFDVGEYLYLPHVNDVGRFLEPFKSQWDAVAFHVLGFAPGPDTAASVLLSRIWRAAGLDGRSKSLTRSAAVDHGVLAAGLGAGVRPFWLGWDGYDLPHLRECDVLGNSMRGTAESAEAARAHVAQPGAERAIIAKATLNRVAFSTVAELHRRLGYGGMIDEGFWQFLVAEGKLDEWVRANALVLDDRMAEYWRALVAPTLSFYADPRRPENAALVGPANVALGKNSWQSSILAVPPGEILLGQAAGGATNGRKSGTFGFHTERQTNPWWVLDLRVPYQISAIRLYNRNDSPQMAARARKIRVEISQDSVNWQLLFAADQGFDFGGVIDQKPLEMKLPPNMVARYCKLSLDDTNFFHLDEVEVYGVPA